MTSTNKNPNPSQESNPSQPHAPQPEPFTPGITRGMVRQHAFELYRDKLPHQPLTLQDWVLAEKDLVQTMQTDNVSK